MWQLLTALQPNSVTLPPGTYHAPAYYDERSLEELTVLLSKLVKGVQFSHLLTWEQARWLRGTSPLGQSSLLVLHGDSGVSFGETDSLEDTLFEQAERIPATWRLVQVPRSRLTKLSWMTRYVQGPLLAMLREQFQSEHHPLRDCSIADFPLSLAAKITHDPIDLSRLIEHTIQHRLSFGQEGRRFRPQDWERSLHWSAGALLAGRIPLGQILNYRAAKFVLHDLGREEQFPRDRLVPTALQQAGLLDIWKENQEPSQLMRHIMHQPIAKMAFSLLSGADQGLIEPELIWAEDQLTQKPYISERWIERAKEEGYLNYSRDLEIASNAKNYLEVLWEHNAQHRFDIRCNPLEPEEIQYVITMRTLSYYHYETEIPLKSPDLELIRQLVSYSPSDKIFKQPEELATCLHQPKESQIINKILYQLKKLKESKLNVKISIDYAKSLNEVDPRLAISFIESNKFWIFRKINEIKDFLWVAELYRSYGQFHSHAESWFEQAIQQSPESVEALLAFARFLKDDLSDLDRAEDLYARAWRLTPEDPELCREFGAFLREQRDDEAWAAEVEQQASPVQE